MAAAWTADCMPPHTRDNQFSRCTHPSHARCLTMWRLRCQYQQLGSTGKINTRQSSYHVNEAGLQCCMRRKPSRTAEAAAPSMMVLHLFLLLDPMLVSEAASEEDRDVLLPKVRVSQRALSFLGLSAKKARCGGSSQCVLADKSVPMPADWPQKPVEVLLS